MKKGFVVCLSVILAAVMGVFGGWLTFPLLFSEEPPASSDGTGTPAASLADTPEKNDVFTDVLLSNISSVRYDCAGIHKDEASLYLKDSRDAENVLIAMKQMELYLESDTVAPVDQPDTTSLWYGGWSLTFYTKNGETYSLSYGGSNIRLSQTVNGYVHQKTYRVISNADLAGAVEQTFGLNV